MYVLQKRNQRRRMNNFAQIWLYRSYLLCQSLYCPWLSSTISGLSLFNCMIHCDFLCTIKFDHLTYQSDQKYRRSNLYPSLKLQKMAVSSDIDCPQKSCGGSTPEKFWGSPFPARDAKLIESISCLLCCTERLYQFVLFKFLHLLIRFCFFFVHIL